jgi:hypothetical protein
LSKIYIVSLLSTDYNDEITTFSESGGGTPQESFGDRAAAQAVCDKLNAKDLKGVELHGYTYDGATEFITDEAKFREILGIEPDADLDEVYIPGTLTDAQALELLKACSLRFYEVQEVEHHV